MRNLGRNDRLAVVKDIRRIPVAQGDARFPVFTAGGFREVTVERVTIEDVTRWANNEVEAIERTDDINYSNVCGECGSLAVDNRCPMGCRRVA